jgi:hypothetical protein
MDADRTREPDPRPTRTEDARPDAVPPEDGEGTPGVYSAAEEEQVAERLRALGYLE